MELCICRSAEGLAGADSVGVKVSFSQNCYISADLVNKFEKYLKWLCVFSQPLACAGLQSPPVLFRHILKDAVVGEGFLFFLFAGRGCVSTSVESP